MNSQSLCSQKNFSPTDSHGVLNQIRIGSKNSKGPLSSPQIVHFGPDSRKTYVSIWQGKEIASWLHSSVCGSYLNNSDVSPPKTQILPPCDAAAIGPFGDLTLEPIDHSFVFESYIWTLLLPSNKNSKSLNDGFTFITWLVSVLQFMKHTWIMLYESLQCVLNACIFLNEMKRWTSFILEG